MDALPINQIILGDALTVLREWPDESVQCVSDTDLVQSANLGLERGHCLTYFDWPETSSYMTSTLCGPAFCALNLELSQFEANFGLTPFDSKEGQDGLNKCDRLLVCHLPAMQRLPAFCRRVFSEPITTKEAVSQVNGHRFDLLDANSFRVGGLRTIFDDSHGIGVALNPDGSIRVDNTSQISQFCFNHITSA